MIFALAGVTPASANVTVTTGQLIKISPPADVLQSGLCSSDKVFTFDEQQGVTLGADVRVDYTAPGSYFRERCATGTVGSERHRRGQSLSRQQHRQLRRNGEP